MKGKVQVKVHFLILLKIQKADFTKKKGDRGLFGLPLHLFTYQCFYFPVPPALHKLPTWSLESSCFSHKFSQSGA